VRIIESVKGSDRRSLLYLLLVRHLPLLGRRASNNSIKCNDRMILQIATSDLPKTRENRVFFKLHLHHSSANIINEEIEVFKMNLVDPVGKTN
jgi:hypothetical protein